MRKLNEKEMRNTNGGGTASATCRYCGTTYEKSYVLKYGFSGCYARGWVLAKQRECEISCAAAMCGI